MCLGEIAQVVRSPKDGRVEVLVDGERQHAIALTSPGPLAPGDWVVLHTGFVAERLTEAEARAALDVRLEGVEEVT